MAKDDNNDNWFSAGLVLILAIIIVALVTELGRGLDKNYVYTFIAFFIVGIFILVILWGVAAILKQDDDEYSPAPFHQTFLSNWLVRGGVALFLVILFTGSVFVAEQSIVPVIDPYDSAQILNSKEQFSTQGTFVTAARTGVYAGFGEEILGYALVSAFTFLQLILWRSKFDDAMSNLFFIGLSAVISCALWGFIFATAHSSVYGLDSSSYLSAAIFGFVSQLANQAVGAPISIIAHFTHNFVVVLNYSIALSIGGVAGFLLFRKKPSQVTP